MKNKKIFKWFLWIIIALVVLYFIIKSILIIAYNYAINSIKDVILEEKNITRVILPDDEYFKFENISFKYNLDNYKIEKTTESSIVIKNDTNTKKIAVLLAPVDTFEELYLFDNKYAENIKKLEFKNEYEFYKNIYNQNNVNLVSHLDSIKEILTLNTLLPFEELLMLSKSYKVRFGNSGNIKYVMMKHNASENMIHVDIFKNNKLRYSFIFGDYNITEINEIISTLNID